MLTKYTNTLIAILFAFTLFSQNIPSYVPKDGLVGWWPFNGNANDESGNGYHGIVYGATLTADRNGNPNSAYSFNGSSDSILISNSDKFDLGGGLFSISVWLKNRITNPYVEIILSKGENFLFLNYGGGFGFENYGKGLGNYRDIVYGDQWVHLVCVKTNLGYSYFVNGKKFDLTFNQYNQSLSDLKYQLVFGQSTNSEKFHHSKLNALIDNFALYNRSLTDQEVEQLYTEKPSCSNISPDISLIGKNTFCEGDSTILKTNTFKNAKYQWFKDGIKVPNANDSVYVVIQSGNFEVVISNDSVCESRSLITKVLVHSVPISVKINEKDTTLCEGETVVLTTENQVGYRFQWKKDNIRITNAINDRISVNSPGNYSVVTYSYCNDSIESNIVKINYKIIPSSIVVAEGKTNFCYGDSVKLKLDKNYNYNYHWYNGNNSIIQITDSVFQVKNSGNYSIQLKEGRCFKMSNIVNVKVELDSLKLFTSSLYYCENDEVYLKVGKVYSDTMSRFQVSKFIWFYNEKELNNKTDYYQLIKNAPGTYYVKMITTNCSVLSNNIEIKKMPLPKINNLIDGDSIISCSPFTIDLSENNYEDSLRMNPPWTPQLNQVCKWSEWDLGDGNKMKFEWVKSSSFKHTYASETDTTFILKLKNSIWLEKDFSFHECSSSIKVMITSGIKNLRIEGDSDFFRGSKLKLSSNYKGTWSVNSSLLSIDSTGVVESNSIEDTLIFSDVSLTVNIKGCTNKKNKAIRAISRLDFLNFGFVSEIKNINFRRYPDQRSYGTDTSFININIPYSQDKSKLIATFTNAPNTIVKINGITQSSGITMNDFNKIVKYTIINDNGKSKEHYVRVNNDFPSNKKYFDSLKFNIPNSSTIYSDDSTYITIIIQKPVDLTNLILHYRSSPFSIVKSNNVIQQNGITPNDFTKTVKYEVTAEDGTIKNYFVTVMVPICSSFFTNLISENDKSNDTKCTGKLTSNVGGGLQPYSYAWSTGATTANLIDLCDQIYTLEVTDKNNCKLIVSKAVGVDSVINPCAHFKATISSVEPTGIHTTICNGSVGVKAEGGQAPYSYVWNNGVKTAAITEVCQGEYQVTVTDKNNCSISLNAKVAVDSTKNACNGFYAKVVSVKDDNGSCTGEIQTQTFGGKLPYSYKWNTSSTDSTLTKICKGVYTLEVMDANKCSFTIEKVVKSTAVIDSCKDFYAVVTELKDDVSEVSCNGKIVVQAKGGKIPYAYAWESGDTTSILENKCAGSYSATITDANNCKVFVSTSISKIQPQGVKLEAVITTKDASSAQTCDGSMFIQVTSGTAPYTYSHSNGDTGNQRTSLCSGVYTVTIKDAKGNEQTLNYVISNPVNTIQTIVNTLKDSVSIDTLKTKLQNECSIAYDAIDSVKIKEIVILSKDSVLVTWTVYAKDKQTFVSKKYVVNKGEGVYTLALSMYCKELKGIGSYFTASQKAYLKLGGNTTTIGITSIESPTMIRVYPNPFTDKVEVSMTEVLDYQIELMDVTGKRVYRQEFKQTKHMAIDFGQLSLGEYLLKVTNKDNVQIRKISRLY